MKKYWDEAPNGYRETIHKGLMALKDCDRHMSRGKG